MLEKLEKETDGKMKRSIDALRNEFTKIRTGRAHPGLLDGLVVEQHGSRIPLNQLAERYLGERIHLGHQCMGQVQRRSDRENDSRCRLGSEPHG